MLDSLRSTLEKHNHQGQMGPYVIKEYIDQYETALDLLQANGEDVATYRVPQSAIRGDSRNVIDANYLLSRVLAVSGYFNVKASVMQQANETNEQLRNLIGFQIPQGR